VKPHFGQWYSLLNFLHFSHRQMVTSPQLGQGKLTAFSSGTILLPQEMQTGILRLSISP